MNSFRPYDFVDEYFATRRLERSLRKKGHTFEKIYPSSGIEAFSNLYSGAIYLPFKYPFDMFDLETLLNHEVGHFEITQEPAEINVMQFDFEKANTAMNIIEDILVNGELPRRSLERVNKKYTGEKSSLTLWEHYTKEERKKVIEMWIEHGILKEGEIEEIYNVIEKTIKKRKKYDSAKEFYEKNEKGVFTDFYNLLTDSPKAPGIGDGPATMMEKPNHRNERLFKELDKIFRRFNTQRVVEQLEESFIGSRISRRYVESPFELYPFVKNKEKIAIEKPQILGVMDCSGSMVGKAEILAKTFLEALVANTDASIIAMNEDYHRLVKSIMEIETLVMGDDEGFEELPSVAFELGVQPKADIFLIITDMVLATNELEGLDYFGSKVKASRKYLLCVEASRVFEHEEYFKDFKRIPFEKAENAIELAKRLGGLR